MIHKDFSENSNPVPGNGMLPAELFEAAGVTVGAQPVPAVKVVTLQPSKADEIIRLGAEAMTRLVKGRSYDDWVAVMRVLNLARATAMREANANEPQGPRYREALAKWFRIHDEDEVYGSIDKANRSRLLKCFDNLAVLSYFRDCIMSPEQRLKVTYPPTVFSRWQAWEKNEAKPRKEGGDEPPPEAQERSGQVKAPLGPVAIWKAFLPTDKATILDGEGRTGLAKLVSSDLLTDLVDHAVAQQIASGSNTKLKTYVHGTLSKVFWQIIGAVEENDTAAVARACAGFLRKCRALQYDYRDLQITSPKKRTPKQG